MTARRMPFVLESTPAPKADIHEQYGNWRLVVDGGKGGAGGLGGQNGGPGGDGGAPAGIDLEHTYLFSRLGAGTGGAGGEGKSGNGGAGGGGDAVHFGENPFLVKWKLGVVDGKQIPLPTKTTADFCNEYGLGNKILQRLTDGEYHTVWGLLEASADDLAAVKCSKGQINGIKGALKAFLSTNGAVVM